MRSLIFIIVFLFLWLADEVPVLVFVFVPLARMGVEHVCVFLFLDELPE
ncbi:hypothetical protein HMPREF0620_1115 [Parascardovia denticolens DSM 10105 = JCM 12538]|uniref:Uncharacterized protein n=1 Tax=Parascardovia denticolens DSM 10105 = JCM 12538 TaxID=864564 RepID=E6JZV6_PARDN|nr:hypothetical protein HMPREF0620_1115 [Parascardovia denticolens DSM 10105 = JCM 12538]